MTLIKTKEFIEDISQKPLIWNRIKKCVNKSVTVENIWNELSTKYNVERKYC
jgi:hypothetical protein